MNEAHTVQHHLTVPPELDGKRLDQALATMLADYSRSLIKQWIEAGDAVLNDAPARPRARVAAGDRVLVQARLAASDELAAQRVQFDLVHADADVIVVNKPAGVVVHPGAGNPDRTLANGLLATFPELRALPRAGLIHRIDKDTSGLLIAGRTSGAYQALVRALAERTIRREYEAIANGVLVAGGTVDAAIGRDQQQRTRMRVRDDGRNAVTHYRVLEKFRGHTHVAVALETGRTHQIRVHFQSIGHPLLGDGRYGGRKRGVAGMTDAARAAVNSFPRQALHAAALEFSHPVSGQVLEFRVPLPGDMAALLDVLRQDTVQAPV